MWQGCKYREKTSGMKTLLFSKRERKWNWYTDERKPPLHYIKGIHSRLFEVVGKMVAYLIVHLDIGIPCLSQAVKQYIATTSLEVAANHCSIDDMMIMKWKSSSTNRRQRVVVKREVSDWLTVISGVPQGSLLGSLFFIICINECWW